MAVARLDQLQYHNAASLVPFIAPLVVSLKAVVSKSSRRMQKEQATLSLVLAQILSPQNTF